MTSEKFNCLEISKSTCTHSISSATFIYNWLMILTMEKTAFWLVDSTNYGENSFLIGWWYKLWRKQLFEWLLIQTTEKTALIKDSFW